jgi:hypothetical protein
MNVQGHKISTQLPYFTIDLSRYQFELDLAREAIYDLQKCFPHTESNVKNYYTSPYDSHLQSTKLDPLCNLVLKLSSFITENALQQKLDFKIVNCWGSIYHPGDFTVLHNHWPCFFSAVVYLDADADSAPLILDNQLCVLAERSKMVLFPGWLDHEVPPTKTQRTVIAFNLTVDFPI